MSDPLKMKSVRNFLKKWSLPEDRRGFPGAIDGESSMQAGDSELCDGQTDPTGTPEGATVQPEQRQLVARSGTTASFVGDNEAVMH